MGCSIVFSPAHENHPHTRVHPSVVFRALEILSRIPILKQSPIADRTWAEAAQGDWVIGRMRR